MRQRTEDRSDLEQRGAQESRRSRVAQTKAVHSDAALQRTATNQSRRMTKEAGRQEGIARDVNGNFADVRIK